MKANLLNMLLMSCATTFSVAAQDYDDIYYDSSQESASPAKVETVESDNAKQAVLTVDDGVVADYFTADQTADWNGGNIVDLRDVDEYNRRGGGNSGYAGQDETAGEVAADSSAIAGENGDTFQYTERIRRFHDPDVIADLDDEETVDLYVYTRPDVNIIVGSPTTAYVSPWGATLSFNTWGWYDVWYDPWYWDPWYYSWGWPYRHYCGWYPGWAPVHHHHGNINIYIDSDRYYGPRSVTGSGSAVTSRTRAFSGTARSSSMSRATTSSYSRGAVSRSSSSGLSAVRRTTASSGSISSSTARPSGSSVSTPAQTSRRRTVSTSNYRRPASAGNSYDYGSYSGSRSSSSRSSSYGRSSSSSYQRSTPSYNRNSSYSTGRSSSYSTGRSSVSRSSGSVSRSSGSVSRSSGGSVSRRR